MKAFFALFLSCSVLSFSAEPNKPQDVLKGTQDAMRPLGPNPFFPPDPDEEGGGGIPMPSGPGPAPECALKPPYVCAV